MKQKLTQKKLKWFIKSYEDKTYSEKQLAFLMQMHEKSLSRMYKQLKAKGINGYYAHIGRPVKERPSNWTEIICKVYEEQHCGAKIMERILDKHYNLHIPHNYIHKILMGLELAKEDKKKQKQRKIRPYARHHSNSAWHVDYKWIEHEQIWLIAYIDDHSRFITGYGMFNEATTANALLLLEIAIKLYGKPREIISDKGSQFYANKKDKDEVKGTSEFEKALQGIGIHLITGRRNHPQTNGKIERWFKTWIEHHWRYKTLTEFVYWYNCIRFHSAIDYETPISVFYRDFQKLLPSPMGGNILSGYYTNTGESALMTSSKSPNFGLYSPK